MGVTDINRAATLLKCNLSSLLGFPEVGEKQSVEREREEERKKERKKKSESQC